MSDAALTLPYTGLRVLDLSQGIAGPYCAGLLGMQGADVIKVEPPGGDWIRITGGGEQGMTALAVMGNLCKRSACIDATRPEGRALLLSMAKGADVFLQNLRPGVIERLGLDYATLSKDNPKLVYLSITGFGPRGPEAKRAGTDSVLQAFTGIANINRESDGTPRRIPFLVPDTVTAVYAAQAVGAALYARERSGKGRHLQISLMEACASLQAAPILDDLLSGGKLPPAITAPSGMFRTRNGYLTLASLNETMFQSLMKALDMQAFAKDPRFAELEERRKNAPEINAEVARRIAGQDTAHWLRVLSEADVLNAEAATYGGFRATPQVLEMHVFDTVEQAPYGPLPLPRVPGGGRDWPVRAAPRCGQHTLEVLAEAGVPEAERGALLAAGVIIQAA